MLLAACSTTKHIEDGEQLYTGIKSIEITGEEHYAASPTGQQAIEEVIAALDCAPNGAIAGSSTYHCPFCAVTLLVIPAKVIWALPSPVP